MKKAKVILKYLVFLGLGFGLFVYIYKDIKKDDLMAGLRHTNFFWLTVSLLLGVLSHYIRAVRWNMLIKPLGYKPKVLNTFLSVLIMYFVNLLMPRAGEVARCTVMHKYEKVPVSKLVGTVIVERIADVVLMLFLAVIIFAINLGVVRQFLDLHPDINQKVSNVFTLSNALFFVLAGLVLVLLVVIVVLVIPKQKGKLWDKVHKIRREFQDGIKSIMNLENKWLFIANSLTIFLLYFLMLFSVFKAFQPTETLSMWTALFVFLMGSFAMLAPVQGGVGAWHFMVIESLFLYGIDKETGGIFALIAHTSTNLIYLIVGLLAYMLLPLVNIKHKPVVHQKEA